MLSYLKDSLVNQCNNSMIGGIVFDDEFAKNPLTAKEMAYKIRLTNSKRRFEAFKGGMIPVIKFLRSFFN